MGNRWGLTRAEVDALIDLVMFYWTPEDRRVIARALPQIYAKIADARVVVDTCGTLTITHRGSDAH